MHFLAITHHALYISKVVLVPFPTGRKSLIKQPSGTTNKEYQCSDFNMNDVKILKFETE